MRQDTDLEGPRVGFPVAVRVMVVVVEFVLYLKDRDMRNMRGFQSRVFGVAPLV